MDGLEKVYESHYDYKMDSKYRVSIPVAFRPDGEEPVRLQSSKEHDEAVIKVFSVAAFEDKFRRIRESGESEKFKARVAGALRMSSRLGSVKIGKLALPKDWAEEVGLRAEGPVKVAGRDSYFIICSEESFRRIVEADRGMDDGELDVL